MKPLFIPLKAEYFEAFERAARRLETAAKAATNAVDRFDDAVNKLTALLGSGYGNVAERLLEALEKQQVPSIEETKNADTQKRNTHDT